MSLGKITRVIFPRSGKYTELVGTLLENIQKETTKRPTKISMLRSENRVGRFPIKGDYRLIGRGAGLVAQRKLDGSTVMRGMKVGLY